MQKAIKTHMSVAFTSGNYKIQVQGHAFTTWTDIQTVTGEPTMGRFDLSNIDIDLSQFTPGLDYSLRAKDSTTGKTSNVLTLSIPTETLTLANAVVLDSGGFPIINLTLTVANGSGSYDLTVHSLGGDHDITVDGPLLDSVMVFDHYDFSVVVPFPIRPTNGFGGLTGFTLTDALSGIASSLSSVSNPTQNTDPSKALVLTLTYLSGGTPGIDLSLNVTNGSGTYRMMVYDPGADWVESAQRDFTGTTNGTITESWSLADLGLVDGNTYQITVYDTDLVVSNTFTLNTVTPTITLAGFTTTSPYPGVSFGGSSSSHWSGSGTGRYSLHGSGIWYDFTSSGWLHSSNLASYAIATSNFSAFTQPMTSGLSIDFKIVDGSLESNVLTLTMP